MNNLNSTQLIELCSIARVAAIEAGRYIQSQFDKHYDIQEKAGGDSLASQVVTTIDFNAQAIILNRLQSSLEKYDLGLLTEETTDDQSRAEKAFFWCIDPMDGTLPFVERRTGYAVSIALISKSGDPVIGVVYIPDLEDCYSAVKGYGVVLNDKPFIRKKDAMDKAIHVYMDVSFKKEPHFEFVTEQFSALVDGSKVEQVQYHAQFGGVRNALGVMLSNRGCYFKFPKQQNGGGSIWDYAATRLFFEELQLPVSDANGTTLNLNNLTTTFMNHCGIIYTTDKALLEFILEMGEVFQ